jgi:hypothetical protein
MSCGAFRWVLQLKRRRERGRSTREERRKANLRIAVTMNVMGNCEKAYKNRFEGPVCGDSLTAKGFLRANLMYKEVLLCDSDGEIRPGYEKK